MLKRNLKLITVLALVVSLGTGSATVHGASLSNNATAKNPTKTEHNIKKNGKNAINPVHSVLENKLGFTKVQIRDAAKSGKTAFDLASEKGITPDQLRAMIIDAKSQKIDQMVSSGKLTQDKANTIKTNFKARMEKWDGSFCHKKA